MDILPWSVDYWKEFADKVTVWDNGSTDGSIEYLRQFPFVTVRHYRTEGMNDTVVQMLKNRCWKGSDADWVVMADMDEMLYAKEGVRNALQSLQEDGVGIVYPQWYSMVSDSVPEYNGELLHRIRPLWTPKPQEAKPLIFRPSLVKEMNFTVGQHSCSPIYNAECKVSKDSGICCFHTERRLSPQYYIEKTRQCQERRSEENLRCGYGFQYALSERDMLQMLERDREKAIRIEL